MFERRKEGGEEGHEGHREGQELNNRMCSHNLHLETTTQTFMLHAHPAHYVLCIRETLASLVVRRVQKSEFLRRSRFVSCVRTPGIVRFCQQQ
jgi:hypothetical protein